MWETLRALINELPEWYLMVLIPALFFIAFTWLSCGLYPQGHSGPSFTDDTAYRAVEQEKERWREYRQTPLDIPKQEGRPDAVVWPKMPG
jgi:hypothetical protein